MRTRDASARAPKNVHAAKNGLAEGRRRGKGSYHHEDLRAELLDAAARYLRANEPTTLTMQVLARASGVSVAAPYHHFSDKTALLAALALDGYARWLERSEKSLARPLSASLHLEALAREWMRFADDHPAHYKVMFLADIGDRERFATLHQTSGRGLAQWIAAIAQCDPSLDAKLLKARAVLFISALHGLVSLRGAGVLTNIPGLPPLAFLEHHSAQALVAMAAPHGAKSDSSSKLGLPAHRRAPVKKKV
jgi:AcrR family transcriptional regulator